MTPRRRMPTHALLPLLLAAPAHAASLQAFPVLIEMNDKAPTAVVSLRNTGDRPIEVQTRVMRWSQSDGRETLVEAEDVIASPPMTSLVPGANYAVRLVRLARTPLAGETSYRVLVDQLPEAAARRGSAVALVTRHSIPVFIGRGGQAMPRLTWRLGQRNGKLALRVSNSGGRRLRLSNVALHLSDGRKVGFGNGLLGYVLAGSTMEWVANVPANRADGIVHAVTDLGPLSARVHAGR